MEAAATRSGGFGVEWSGLVVGGGQIDQCVGELGGARPVVGCQDRSSTVHGWRSERWILGVCGSVMREGWVEIFKCVMSMSACEDCVRSVKHLKVK